MWHVHPEPPASPPPRSCGLLLTPAPGTGFCAVSPEHQTPTHQLFALPTIFQTSPRLPCSLHKVSEASPRSLALSHFPVALGTSRRGCARQAALPLRASQGPGLCLLFTVPPRSRLQDQRPHHEEEGRKGEGQTGGLGELSHHCPRVAGRDRTWMASDRLRACWAHRNHLWFQPVWGLGSLPRSLALLWEPRKQGRC